jgi:iron complex transport system substrate-binding protein
MRIISLLPAASEILCDLGVMDNINAVSHECNYPELLKEKLQVTSSNIPNNIEQKLIND